MSLVDKMKHELLDEIPFKGDVPTVGHRKVSDTIRIMDTLRGLEVGMRSVFEKLQEEKNDLTDRYIALLEESERLGRRLAALELAKKMSEQGISKETQIKLLGSEEQFTEPQQAVTA